MRETADRLEAFYAGSLGRCARDMALRRLFTLWPDLAGENALGFGYCDPYLSAYRRSANRVVLVSPASQGAVAHRSSRGVMGCVADETLLPFSDHSFSRVLCVHAVEEADDLPGMLRELWRVTEPEGRIVVIAAGRSGLWARADSLPFGAGRPFSRKQLRDQLTRAGFQPTVGAGALYGPPIARLSGPKASYYFERTGETVWPRLAGLVLVEAIKRLYIEPTPVERARVRSPIFGGIAQPSVDRTVDGGRVERQSPDNE